MTHRHGLYQLICIEYHNGISVKSIKVNEDDNELHKALIEDYNHTLVGDHIEPDLKDLSDLKNRTTFVRTSKDGKRFFTWEIKLIILYVDVSYPLIHRHEDGVELKFKPSEKVFKDEE